MGFICDDKNKKFTVPYTDRVNRGFEEKMGLSNTIFQESEFNYCLDPFNAPLYYVSGTTKPTDYIFGSGCTASTGLITATTCNSVYNFSYIDDFDLEFVVTGNTSFTGYTGKFCMTYYKSPLFTLNSGSTQILQQPLSVGNIATIVDCVDYSAMTATTTTINYIKNISLTDTGTLPYFTEWMIKSFNIFESKCVPDPIINTWDLSYPVTSSFNYDEDSYFVTVSNPPIPTFITLPADIDDLILKQEPLIPTFDGQTDFLIRGTPTNQVSIVTVNGATLYNDNLTSGSVGDYILDFSNTPDGGVIVKFKEPTGGLMVDDLAIISYIEGSDPLNLPANKESSYFTMESFIVTGITIDYTGATTGLTSNIVNHDTTNGIYQIYLKHDIWPPSTVLISINGEQLGPQYDFTKSSIDLNKLNCFPQIVIKENDIITVLYFKSTIEVIDAGDLGKLLDNRVTITWGVSGLLQPSKVKDAYFIVQVTEETDVSFTGISYTNVVEYTYTSRYSTIFEDVAVGKNYIYRVLFIVNYITLTGDVITVNSISSNGIFDLSNDFAMTRNR